MEGDQAKCFRMGTHVVKVVHTNLCPSDVSDAVKGQENLEDHRASSGELVHYVP